MTFKSAKGNDGPPAKTPVILALEASGDLLAAAVWVDGAVQNHQAYVARHGHAAYIATLVEQVMKMAGIEFTDINSCRRRPGSGVIYRHSSSAGCGKGILSSNRGCGYGCQRSCGAGRIVIVVSLFWLLQKRVGVLAMHSFFDSGGTALHRLLRLCLLILWLRFRPGSRSW